MRRELPYKNPETKKQYDRERMRSKRGYAGEADYNPDFDYTGTRRCAEERKQLELGQTYIRYASIHELGLFENSHSKEEIALVNDPKFTREWYQAKQHETWIEVNARFEKFLKEHIENKRH